MFHDLDGPLDIIKNAREWLDSKQKNRELISTDCFHCFSILISIIPALYLADGLSFFIYWFAVAGGSALVNSIYLRMD